jgi:hypothetical protein
MSLRLPDCQCQVELRSVPCGLGFSRGLLKRTKTGSLKESPITRRRGTIVVALRAVDTMT